MSSDPTRLDRVLAVYECLPPDRLIAMGVTMRDVDDALAMIQLDRDLSRLAAEPFRARELVDEFLTRFGIVDS